MLQAIHPKLPLLKGDHGTKVKAEADKWGQGMVREMSRYPAQMPTKSGYRRTGTYGRMARTSRASVSGNYEVTFSNPTVYGEYVGGTKDQQAQEMARRHWPRVDEVGDRLWSEAQGNIERVVRESIN